MMGAVPSDWARTPRTSLPMSDDSTNLLGVTTSWPWGGGPSIGVLDWGGMDTSAVQKAPKGLDPGECGGDILGVGLLAPKLLGDCCEARPHRLLQVTLIDRLSPHLAVAAENKFAELWGGPAARILAVDGSPVHIEIIQIPRGGVIADVEKHIVAVGDHFGHIGHPNWLGLGLGVRARVRDRSRFPDVYDGLLVELGLEMIVHFAPLDRPPPLGDRNVGHTHSHIIM